MTIFNMVGWGSWGGWWEIVPLDAIDNLEADAGNAKATITWTDPTDPVYNWVTLVTWSSTILVRKTWSAPLNSSDWTVVVTETTRNQYSSSWYVDTWLTNWTTYYYAAFAIWDNGTESAISNIDSVTPEVDYLCFTANTAWSTIALNKQWTPNSLTLQISTDWTTWSSYTIWDTITLSNIWDKVYMRCASTSNVCKNGTNYYYFSMTGSIAWSGDINYLKNSNSTTTLSDYCYIRLFTWCTSLTSSPKLPATTLANYCYEYMFDWCTGLITAPELPATTTYNYSYGYMFQWCSSLTTPPELPATTLWNSSYQDMFNNCTWLISMPELPATTCPYYGYSQMFKWCTSLVTVRKIHATSVWERWLQEMFHSCTSLTTAPELKVTTFSWPSSCRYMFYWCTSLTTPPVLSATTVTNYCYFYMFSWCIALTTPPSLPATTLGEYCYQYMFEKCSGLTALPELPATTLTNSCYSGMFRLCTKIKLSSSQTWDYQTPYRIPTTWTGTTATNALSNMFTSTWWTFTSNPSINTTYYTSNTVV